MTIEKYLGWYTWDKSVANPEWMQQTRVPGAYDVYAVSDENGSIATKLVHTDGEVLYSNDSPYEIALNHVAEVAL
ncbi:hypothetical protein HCA69_12555 [Listeria grandensis]|uniref:Uncharacterized protein n=1 Tax=Listeria grandensis TaxID=1494963 RepID=A0A7X0Y609_9LIST|nr:hypothetical protein [Listeria grandensis]MBC1937204.1 hypothetical protein [Listeria grandensis]